MDIKNKTIVVAGATGGIGSPTVRKLSDEGANLVLLARDENILKSLIKELGANHSYLTIDFTDTDSVLKCAEELISKFDKVDVLLNMAGIGIYQPIADVTEKDWDQSFEINVKSPFFLTQGLLPLLEKVDDSLVLNIGSGAGVMGMRGRSVYCATKFALRGWTLSLVEEYQGISPSFCLITLGSTLTEFGPMTLLEKQKESDSGKAYFTPEWVSSKLVEIIKDDKREVEYVLYPTDYDLGNWDKP